LNDTTPILVGRRKYMLIYSFSRAGYSDTLLRGPSSGQIISRLQLEENV
jgi:hypothetical protein